MSGRRPPSELIMGQLNFDPRDPKGNEIRLKALHYMLAGHPDIEGRPNTPRSIGEALADNAGPHSVLRRG
ncbi:MAG: hypothetical protein AAGB32_03190 [Pseudomonadota bacterium]